MKIWVNSTPFYRLMWHRYNVRTQRHLSSVRKNFRWTEIHHEKIIGTDEDAESETPSILFQTSKFFFTIRVPNVTQFRSEYTRVTPKELYTFFSTFFMYVSQYEIAKLKFRSVSDEFRSALANSFSVFFIFHCDSSKSCNPCTVFYSTGNSFLRLFHWQKNS